MVKILFREIPVMVNLSISELAALKRVKVRLTPSKGGSLRATGQVGMFPGKIWSKMCYNVHKSEAIGG
jgi:hypothetical protein